jgi:hypothetical protein
MDSSVEMDAIYAEGIVNEIDLAAQVESAVKSFADATFALVSGISDSEESTDSSSSESSESAISSVSSGTPISSDDYNFPSASVVQAVLAAKKQREEIKKLFASPRLQLLSAPLPPLISPISPPSTLSTNSSPQELEKALGYLVGGDGSESENELSGSDEDKMN